MTTASRTSGYPDSTYSISPNSILYPRTFTLKAVVESKQTLETSAGPKEVFRLRVETHFAGKFESTGDIFAYVSTDAFHTPVRIQAPFALGNLFAELTDFKAGQRLAASATGSGR